MSVRLRTENCCDEPGCMRPARYGSLCSRCFMAASPARRAVELLADEAAALSLAAPVALVTDEGAAWLSDLWAA